MAAVDKPIVSWFPKLRMEVWLLALGRLLSQTGTGVTAFLAPIFFVNQLGLSATQVGWGLGGAAIAGVGGRALGGSLADGHIGRRWTLIGAALISAIGSFVLAEARDFALFLLGNLLLGVGVGLYWPANEAMVADLTTAESRNEAYAVTRLCDNLGLGLGVVLGGVVVQISGDYRLLFWIDGVSFVLLAGVVYTLIREPERVKLAHSFASGWGVALRDRVLQVYSLVNVLLTAYIVLLSSTLPLYFSNFVNQTETYKGFDPATISALYAWHLLLSVLFQLPAARLLKHFGQVQILILSALLWGLGFVGIWLTGIATQWPLVWAIAALAVLTLAVVTYLPSASSLVVQLAPESLRGVYLSINSQCWALGSFLAPPLGGWAMDQTATIAHGFWLGMAASIFGAIAILLYCDRLIQSK